MEEAVPRDTDAEHSARRGSGPNGGVEERRHRTPIGLHQGHRRGDVGIGAWCTTQGDHDEEAPGPAHRTLRGTPQPRSVGRRDQIGQPAGDRRLAGQRPQRPPAPSPHWRASRSGRIPPPGVPKSDMDFPSIPEWWTGVGSCTDQVRHRAGSPIVPRCATGLSERRRGSRRSRAIATLAES